MKFFPENKNKISLIMMNSFFKEYLVFQNSVLSFKNTITKVSKIEFSTLPIKNGDKVKK
jgi:hypothetical protein